MTLTPAYGRDYKNKKDVLADFLQNKDFVVNDITSKWDGKVCNRADLQREGKYARVIIRYDQRRKLVVVEL